MSDDTPRDPEGAEGSDMDIYDEIKAERERQDAKWGGPAHDDQHSVIEWVGFIKKHATRSLTFDGPIARKQLVRVAALAVAAIESMDRTAITRRRG